MKIEVVKEFALRNSTENNNSAAKDRAIAAFLYRKPPPTTLEKLVNYYNSNKQIWLYKITLPFYFVKYQYKQIVRYFNPLDCGLGRVKILSEETLRLRLEANNKEIRTFKFKYYEPK